MVTLGFGLTYWGYRNWAFMVRHMHVYGTIDVSHLTQSTTHAPREAEGLRRRVRRRRDLTLDQRKLYDGVTAHPHDVAVEVGDAALLLRQESGWSDTVDAGILGDSMRARPRFGSAGATFPAGG